MTNSLQEQLIKSGLVSEERAEKIRKHKNKPKGKSKKQPPPSARKTKAEKEVKPPISAEEQRQQQKLLRKKIKEYLKSNKVNDADGQVAFHFVKDNVVKRLYVNNEQQKALTSGALFIVPFGERHYLISQEHIVGLNQLDPSVQVINCAVDQNILNGNAEDDYADYQVPDDLMW